VAYVERRPRDVAAEVVGHVGVDLDHLDDEQMVRLAEYYFDGRRCETSWMVAGRAWMTLSDECPSVGVTRLVGPGANQAVRR
jgi:hypothetical protein